MLEASASLLILLTTLVAAWYVVDIYQRGTYLQETLESVFYDGVVPEFVDSDARALAVNRIGVVDFTAGKIAAIRDELEHSGIPSSHLRVHGIVAEISWPLQQPPRLKWTREITDNSGDAGPSALSQEIDIYVARLADQRTVRQRFVRANVWPIEPESDTALSTSFLIVGIAASISLDRQLPRVFYEVLGRKPLITRSSINVLRRDL